MFHMYFTEKENCCAALCYYNFLSFQRPHDNDRSTPLDDKLYNVFWYLRVKDFKGIRSMTAYTWATA